MQSTSKNPAVTKAYTWIKRSLDEGAWPPGQFLPSVTNLAARIGVSRVSVLRALAHLKSEQRITGEERSRTRVGGVEIQNQPAETPSGSWQMKRTALESDILSGVFARQGTLPSFKQLQERYGTCYQTMRKILSSLVTDNLVTQRKKKYSIAQTPGHMSSKRIVFVANRSELSHSSALNPGRYQILELFEQECSRRGLVPDVVEVDFYNSAEMRRVIFGATFSRPVEGYILDIWWYLSDEFHRSFVEILTRLEVLKKPVAILDELGDVELPAQFTHNPSFQVFSIEGKNAGSKIAAMLLSMGHRSVAYISAFHNRRYSLERFNGVAEQYAKAGREYRAIPIVNDYIGQPLGHAFAVSGLDDATIRKTIALGRTESQASDMYKVYLRYKKNAGSLHIAREDRAAIRRNVAALKSLSGKNIDQRYFAGAGLAIIREAEGQLTDLFLAPLFEQAFAIENITAWVCVTDRIALAALAFLRKKRMPVPKKISVIGFDNHPVLTFENRLTTYDFNAFGFVNAMLNFIARPSHPRGSYTHRVIEVAGTIIYRSTVRTIGTS